MVVSCGEGGDTHRFELNWDASLEECDEIALQIIDEIC
jgi:hypothetical protein